MNIFGAKSRITINLNDVEFKKHVSNTLNLFDFLVQLYFK